ncbi:DEAD/DEAH box helicase [Thiothrix nivea]|uniref:SNF2-related protein n=1 Tax=Thiothrix nivea (strain ATCC 35100 / DSM 5205 / JP2) TaxID=870187 RepID=A0A656HCV9_THINJ|nr:DEAD/DEAH box helicase [Thiothrix nivea]EIJ34012.1 SNF2-related protein [Thiothrix nivea DSM 5205]
MHLKTKHLDLLADNNLPQTVLFNVFDTTTIQRGIEYFDTGRVISFRAEKISNGNVSITAKVQGSNQNPYVTTVNYNDLSPRWITGVCTCPVTVGCKHAVAALFEYLDHARKQKAREPQRKPAPSFLAATMPTAAVKPVTRSPIDTWLQSLGSADQAPLSIYAADELNEPHANLLYLLGSEAHHPDLITLSLYRANVLKKGGYGKPGHVQLESLLTPYRARNYQYEPQDLMIAQLLALPGMRFLHHWNKGTLTGKAGEQVLLEVLKTGRAFWANIDTWQRNNQPLHYGDVINFQFQWRENAQGEYVTALEPDIPIDKHFWLNGKLWYIDNLNLTCGWLEHPDLTPAQVEKFLNAPPIPPAQVDSVSERLLEILPDTDIPTPSPNVLQQIEEVQAELVPELYLRTTTLPDTDTATPIASLRFNYGGKLLQPEQNKASSLLKTGGKRYRIQRDMAGEQAALEALEEYGFEPASNRFSHLKRLELLMHPDNPGLTALRWHDFLDHGVAALRHEGWDITLDDNFDLQFDVVGDLDAAWEESETGNDWFEISLGFEIEGQRINLLPILVNMLHDMESPQALRELLQRQPYLFVPLAGNRWAKLEAQRIGGILDTLVELYDQQPLNANGNLELSKYQGTSLGELLNAPGMRWKGAEELLALTQKLRDFQGIQPVALPEGLNADLRPYQHEGLNWLQFLREYQFNGILADDMGLGKTLQTLAHLLLEKQSGRLQEPALVVAPTSLMGNWRREAARFTPDLRVQIIHGTDRHRHFDSFGDYDLILTTYPLMVRDEEQYLKHIFHYLILDEAQAIKNAAARTTQIIYGLKANHRLCLTGTPLENHLGELWSMFHFLMPGFLGQHDKFTRLFRTPIEKQGDGDRQWQLRKRVQPFMLRRTKELVAHELPPKSDIIRSATLEGKQRDLYETVRLAMDKKVQDEISRKGFARSQIMILDALLKLRQVCCDPRLVKLEKAQKVKQSAKLELLMTLLPEMLEEGRKVLLFSQFTSMLALIEEELEKAGIVYSKLTGQTKNRDEAIAAFQEGDAKVFLISLKAGGTGLNLTAADTVIHYDPWWNPAVEQQATDRAHRIGQDKPVFVYKLITEDTVEEKILKLQEKKQALADGLYSDSETREGVHFSSDDLMDLLKPLEQ